VSCNQGIQKDPVAKRAEIKMIAKKTNYLKVGFAVLIAIYGIVLARDFEEPRFLDNVDHIPHEAGHMLFSWFGQFLMVLGGTIGQLVPPIGFAIYFWMRRELFSFSVVLFWVGQNLLNIARYIKDAQAMDLPLVSVGGGDAIHDWNYLLRSVNLLRHDQGIGNFVLVSGLLLMLGSVLLTFFYSRAQVDGD
jgi:hypothetical protein